MPGTNDKPRRDAEHYFSSIIRLPRESTPIPAGAPYSRISLRKGALYERRYDWATGQWSKERKIERVEQKMRGGRLTGS